MAISEKKIYPRTGDMETVYLKNVVTDPGITVGDFTIYNDFVHDPRQFEKNNVLYHYPINHDKLKIGLSKVDKPINAGIHVRNVGTQFSGITVL